MIRSMTGFGSNTLNKDEYKILVELKSINHRYTDINIKMSKELSLFEFEIRKLLKSKLMRGKLEANILFVSHGLKSNITIDESLVESYILNLRDISEKFNIDSQFRAIDILRLNGVINNNDNKIEDETIKNELIDCINIAFDNFDKSRIHEGNNLGTDILSKLEEIENIINSITKITDRSIQEYKSRMIASFNELLEDKSIAQDRILVEAGILSDKICIDEELVRLRSHISQVKTILSENNEEVGRRLDFILQEFNRESNTILSKSIDIEIVNYGIELKSIIEKIREQAQNLI